MLDVNLLVFAQFAFFDLDSEAAYIFIVLIGGPAFFTYVYLRYRNANQRHIHEKETPIKVSNMQQYDNFVEHKKGQVFPQVAGANDTQVGGSLLDEQRDGLPGIADTLIDLASSATLSSKGSSWSAGLGMAKSIKRGINFGNRRR